jgi:hypothetical protein
MVPQAKVALALRRPRLLKTLLLRMIPNLRERISKKKGDWAAPLNSAGSIPKEKVTGVRTPPAS